MGQHVIEPFVNAPGAHPRYDAGDKVTITGPDGQQMLNFTVFLHGPHPSVMSALTQTVVILDCLDPNWRVTNHIKPRLAKMSADERLLELQASMKARAHALREDAKEQDAKGNTHRGASMRGHAHGIMEAHDWVESLRAKRYVYRKHLPTTQNLGN